MILDWAIAGERLAGQTTSGDRGVVVERADGALVAVIDGLGHGPDAAVAADAAERVLLASARSSVGELVERCHRELRGTRGAVMTIATVDATTSTLSWLGVGNVEAVIVRGAATTRDESIAMRGGTVGYKLPSLTVRTLPIAAGDTLVMATDGVRHGFRVEVSVSRTPREIADAVIARWSTTTDDSCVVVARYTGAEATS